MLNETTNYECNLHNLNSLESDKCKKEMKKGISPEAAKWLQKCNKDFERKMLQNDFARELQGIENDFVAKLEENNPDAIIFSRKESEKEYTQKSGFGTQKNKKSKKSKDNSLLGFNAIDGIL